MKAYAATSSHNETFSMDSDGMAFIMDNLATGGIYNIRSMFVGKFEPQVVELTTANGVSEKKQMVGTIWVAFRDDEGTSHTYDIPRVVYDPDSPHNLLGIPFLAKYFASTGESRDSVTWTKSGAEESEFS